jgi:hypothetical protein
VESRRFRWRTCASSRRAATPDEEIPAPGTPYEARPGDLCPGLGREVGALGVQPGRSTESLAGARTVDYAHSRGSVQSGDAPSSARSGRVLSTVRPSRNGNAIRRRRAAGCLSPGGARIGAVYGTERSIDRLRKPIPDRRSKGTCSTPPASRGIRRQSGFRLRDGGGRTNPARG